MTTGSLVRMLFERTVCTRNGKVRIRCQITNKQLCFLVTLRGVRSVLKWQNNCGNKGNGMSLNINKCLSVYHNYNRQLYMRCLLLREYRKKCKIITSCRSARSIRCCRFPFPASSGIWSDMCDWFTRSVCAVCPVIHVIGAVDRFRCDLALLYPAGRH